MKNAFWLLFFICAILSIKSLYGQSTIVVVYSNKVMFDNSNSVAVNGRKSDSETWYFGQLMMSNLMSYYHVSLWKVNLFKKFEHFQPSNFSHHSALTSYDEDGVYQIRYWPKVKEENLINDAIPNYKWIVDSTDKYFLNNKCRAAYSVIEPNDTMFVLFSVDIPLPFGPGDFIGAPGLVLKGFRPKTKHEVIAKKIEKVHYEMRLPHIKN